MKQKITDLRKAQYKFAEMVPKLIQEAIRLGFNPRLGEAYRSQEEAARLSGLGLGTVNSLHCSRLAIDLILDRNGEWLKESSDYAPLGEYWESIGGTWGGRFAKADGNHFSLSFGGVK